MSSTRRQFLQRTIATGATGAVALSAGALGLSGCASTPGPGGPSTGSGTGAGTATGAGAASGSGQPAASASKRILILGGTGFLGPALIDVILARGHGLTLFNSGTTEARRQEAGRPSVIPAGVELLVGNRDPDKTADDRRRARNPDLPPDPGSPRGLTQLEGKKWDAVIDTSGYFPRMVNASASLLAPSVGQYIFISSISVYQKTDQPGMDETAELHTLADPTVEEFGAQFENYGGGKAMCEAAAENAMPGRTTNIRPGFIVGRRDTSRRWIYWPHRMAQGGEMIAPGTASDPVQIIDVRDLAEWIVHCIEARVVGAYNATSVAGALTMGTMLEGCRAAAGAATKVAWVDAKFLEENEVSLPIYAPPTGEFAGFHRVNVDKAVKAGLRFRSVEDTARDTLAWYASLPEELRQKVVPPEPTLESEAELLKKWRGRQG